MMRSFLFSFFILFLLSNKVTSQQYYSNNIFGFATSNTFTFDSNTDEPYIKFGEISSGNTFVHNKIVQPAWKTQCEVGYKQATNNFRAWWGSSSSVQNNQNAGLLENVIEDNY